MSIKGEVQTLGVIMRGVKRLTPAGRRWLLRRLVEVECSDQIVVEPRLTR